MTEAPAAPRRLWLGLILAIGAALRFTSLFSLPIFNDEAIYAVWARSILAGDWLAPLGDGKQPLFYWLAAFVAGVVNDPFAALRVTAALAGVAGIGGAYLAGTAVAGRRVGLAASWAYAIVPYLVINDRLGLGDGLAAAAGLYIFWGGFRLGRSPGWSAAAVLGVMLGLALLVKTTAVLLVPAAVLGAFAGREPGEKAAARLAGGGLVALALALLPTAVVVVFARFGPYIVGKSSSFLLSARDIIGFPYRQWLANLALLNRWLLSYLQWPALALTAAGLVAGDRRLKAKIYVALLAAAVPLLFMAAAARTLFSRYAAISVPFIVLAAALSYESLREAALPAQRQQPASWRAGPWLAAILFTVAALSQDIALIRGYQRFAWTADDRWQYIEGWPSGYGLAGAAGFLKAKSAAAGPGKFKVIVDEGLGFPRDGLLLQGFDVGDMIVVRARRTLPRPRNDQSYFYIADDPRFDRPEFAKKRWRWPLAATFSKPGGKSAWHIYKGRPRRK